MKKEILRMDRVTHIQKGVTLLENFNIHVFSGEIMGLLCINRHGLEAFLRIISQNIPIHSGQVFFEEKLVNNYQYSLVDENPVAIIEKQSHLVEDLTVADNIFVLSKAYKEYVVNTKLLEKRLKAFTDEISVNINPNQYVNQLTATEKFIVELLKAAISGAKLIVIKEIRSFIGKVDVLKIHEIMRYYSNQGISFLYVCNHHEEAFEICTRAALMENGKILKVLDKSDFRGENIWPYALDFSKKDKFLKHQRMTYLNNRQNFFELKNITTEKIKDLNLSIRQGECLVILDTDNSIIEEFKEIILHPESVIAGEIFLEGELFKNDKQLKLEFIDENPAKSMLFYDMNYMDNLCFLMDKKFKYNFSRKKMQRSIYKEYRTILGEDIDEYDIQNLDAKSLYSLIYYRIHIYCPKVVICIHPFSGADMYLRHHITTLIRSLLKKDITVIILSLNLADSLSVADRLIMIGDGKIVHQYDFD